MEKFRIGMYGMAQVMAIAYGVLGCGAAVKVNRPLLDYGYSMPPVYYNALFYRDHGFWLFLIVLFWAGIAAYLSSEWGQWKMDEGAISATGITLTILFVMAGTSLAMGAAMPPPHLITGLK